MKNLNVSRISKSISSTFGKTGLAAVALGLGAMAATAPQQAYAQTTFYTFPLRINEELDNTECTSIGEGIGVAGDFLMLGYVPTPLQAAQALNSYMTLFASGSACSTSRNGPSMTQYDSDLLIAAGNMLVGGALFANGGTFVNKEFVMTNSGMFVHFGNNKVKGVDSATISPLPQKVYSDSGKISGYEAINGSDLAVLSSAIIAASPSNNAVLFSSLSSRLILVSDNLAGIQFNPAAISSNLASVSDMAANFATQSFTAAQSGNLSGQISTISAQIAAGAVGDCNACSYISSVLEPNRVRVSNQLAALSGQVGNVTAVSSYLSMVQGIDSRVSSALNVILAGGSNGTVDPNLYASVSNMMTSVANSLNSNITTTTSVSNIVSAWGSVQGVTNLTNNINASSSSLTQININIDRLLQVAGNGGGIAGQPGVSGGGGTNGSAPAQSNGQNSLAIGYGSQANGTNSVAIGYNSTAKDANEFSVGGNGILRRITNVANPIANNDAATKAYIDQKVANAGGTGLSAEGERAVTRTAARGAASAGAMAQIPQVDTTRTVGVGAGWANVKGANGFAVGVSGRIQDMFVGKASYAFASGDKGKYVKGKGMWGAGGLVQW